MDVVDPAQKKWVVLPGGKIRASECQEILDSVKALYGIRGVSNDILYRSIRGEPPSQTLWESLADRNVKNLRLRKETNRKLVLILEDDSMSMKLFRALLEQRAGYVKIGAEDGKIALSLARLHHPDLIQSCISNPTLSGFEFARLLKGDDRTKQIPLICVSATGAGMKGIERKVFDAGFNAYLPKPITQVKYLGLIDSFLREG